MPLSSDSCLWSNCGCVVLSTRAFVAGALWQEISRGSGEKDKASVHTMENLQKAESKSTLSQSTLMSDLMSSIDLDATLQDTLLRASMVPGDLYKDPVTTTMEYGWFQKEVQDKNDVHSKWWYGRRKCDITRH